MGKLLVINGADFTANGTKIVDVLAKIKLAFENNYYEHYRYQNGVPTSAPATAATNRNASGPVNALTSGFPSFIVTPKTGFQIVPCQSNNTTPKFDFQWTQSAVTFEGFDTNPWCGINVAYGDNRNIPNGMGLWEFIDITLAP